jgi:hypothetical protein
MQHDTTDSPIVAWPCYEPAGRRIELTEADLVQHVLLLGSTGSGKSTLLTAATIQFVLHRAESSKDKIGLLELDAKADDIVPHVREAAQRAGRHSDVLVFGPGGDHSFDLFGTLRSLDDVERTTRRVLMATDPMGGDNAFWQTTPSNMFSAAFSLWVEDVEQLATVRSKRCFVMAAAQGLHSLGERVGPGPTRALVNNFNTLVFLRGWKMK